VQYLVDPGSNRSVIRQNAITNIDKYQTIQTLGNIKIIQAETDAPLKVVGQQKLHVQIGETWQAFVTFLVSATLAHDCIIGLDILNKHYGYQALMKALRHTTATYTEQIAKHYLPKTFNRLANINVMEPIKQCANDAIESTAKITSTLDSLRTAITENVKKIAVESLRDLRTTTTASVHTIKMKPGTIPKRTKMRKLPHKYIEQFKTMINDMLQAKRIQPSVSPWASAVRIVGKPDGSIRTTIDYKHINDDIENDAYPMRFITDIFSRLGKAKVFTVIDCTSGYFQVPLDEQSRKYTAFRCILGLFEFLVMPMGIKGAAERFQRMMEIALHGLYSVICEVYQDDLIIYSNTLEDHWIHVNLVLERLAHYVIKVKLSKCKIAQTRIEYLSHIIENGTIRPSPRKTQALFQHKTPTTVSQLHKMHGLAAYYKRFVRNFSDIAKPIREAINECTQQKAKNIVNWNEQRQRAYDTIRQLLTNEPILRLPQFDKPFQVETDASDYGCGGVLTQEHDGTWHPIAYFSQSFTGAQTRYSTSDSSSDK
jgi:hypothetical protein